jgi:cation diffusion facilitator CzcD-associated flavoprotein CzcO
MRTWLANMPKGMRLKSEGFASDLYDPDSALTLGRYCKERGVPYADHGLPVPVETFSSYGLEFQRRFVPELENKHVVAVCRSSKGFQVHLEDGEVIAAQKLVVAVGLSYFDYVPPVLSGFSEEFVTHSSRHNNPERFKGCEVAVVGAGASAVDLAALLHRAGAFPHLVVRKPKVRFHDPPSSIPPSLLSRLRFPVTGIGPGWKLLFCTSAPQVFRCLPEQFRLDVVRRFLGPSAGWFVKDEIVGKVPFHLGVAIKEARARNGRVTLELTDSSEGRQTLVADHVIAATGYKVDLRRLSFLNSDLLAGIRSAPVLSSNFESSVPGLYFVGTSAANAFGPVLRFTFGARFTARRISGHLAQLASHYSTRHSTATA